MVMKREQSVAGKILQTLSDRFKLLGVTQWGWWYVKIHTKYNVLISRKF